MFASLFSSIPYIGAFIKPGWFVAVSQGYNLAQFLYTTYNSTSPVQLTKNATLTLMDCCLPPQTKYPLLCVTVVCAVGASTMDPTGTCVAGTELLTKSLLEKCLR